MCEYCQGFTSFNHILFKCPASQDLWRIFDETHNLTIPPSQRLEYRCTWRLKWSKRPSTILAQLEMLHLYHVWSRWWSVQKSPDDPTIIHPHSWLRRVITCYLCFNNQTQWSESPHLSRNVSPLGRNCTKYRTSKCLPPPCLTHPPSLPLIHLFDPLR